MRHAANKIRRTANMAGAVPYRLLDEASWATQGCAPLFRSAITFAARCLLRQASLQPLQPPVSMRRSGSARLMLWLWLYC